MHAMGSLQGNSDKASKTTYRWEFPFEPYEIQRQFMTCLYETLEQRHCAILESPTGTGKSLSIICSALHWLSNPVDAKTDNTAVNTHGMANDDEPHWLSDAAHQDRKEQIRRDRIKAKRDKIRARIEKQNSAIPGRADGLDGTTPTRNYPKKKKTVFDVDNDPFELEHYESASDMDYSKRHKSDTSDSEDDRNTSSDDSDVSEHSTDTLDSISAKQIKVYFASRTHSQLSQFLQEVSRTPFGKEISTVALGSRKQMCVHPKVSSHSSSTRVNEECQQLLDGSSKETSGKRTSSEKSSSGCPYYSKGSLRKLKDHILYKVQDIEEVVSLGRKQSACAYFAARQAVKDAQLVAVPYSMLLHRKTRETLGIDLKGSVVICDEAHNIIDAVNEVHSVTLTLELVESALEQVTTYHQKYRSRLLAKNKLYIGHLLVFLKRIQSFLVKQKTVHAAQSQQSRIIPVADFVFQCEIDHINMFKLATYLEASHLANKVQGVQDSIIRKQQTAASGLDSDIIGNVKLHQKPSIGSSARVVAHDGPDAVAMITKTGQRKIAKKFHDISNANITKKEVTKSRFPLYGISSFVQALTNVDEHGSILIVNDPAKPVVKFVMLDPAAHFGKLVKDCRSVVLAGGTMHPIDEYIRQLFGEIPRENVNVFSCGHVIPEKNLLCVGLSSGPSGQPMDLTFHSRSKPSTMDDVGNALINLCNVVPAGIVVFVPSYSYEKQLHDRWSTSGIAKRLAARKKIFREPRGSGLVDSVLKEYSEACYSNVGGILFSVVGGKLSEGINFKDELARCVCMVGMPYPHAFDPEIKARMAYLDSHQRALGISTPTAGNKFYENQCMKAVNQCIGRAIRHQNDFASVVLMDQRYNHGHVVAQLPKWITNCHQKPASFGQAVGLVARFFKSVSLAS